MPKEAFLSRFSKKERNCFINMGCKGVVFDGAFPLGEIINTFSDGYVSIKDIDIYIDYRNKEEIVDVIF